MDAANRRTWGRGITKTYLVAKHTKRARCSPLVPCFPSEELKKEKKRRQKGRSTYEVRGKGKLVCNGARQGAAKLDW